MEMSPVFLLALSFLHQCVTQGFGYRILLTPPPFESHIIMQLSIGEELLRRGDEVYIALGSRYPKSDSILQSGIKILNHHIPQDFMYPLSPDYQQQMSVDLAFNPSDNMVKTIASGQKEYAAPVLAPAGAHA